jgi:hypothetical protein
MSALDRIAQMRKCTLYRLPFRIKHALLQLYGYLGTISHRVSDHSDAIKMYGSGEAVTSLPFLNAHDVMPTSLLCSAGTDGNYYEGWATPLFQ